MEANLRKHYQDQSDRLSARIASLRSRARYYVAAEIASFLAFVALLVAATLVDDTRFALCAAVAMLAVYALVRRSDVRCSQAVAWAEAEKSVADDGLAYLDGDHSRFADGSSYIDPRHDFTFDLDVFGGDSLFQRINRTVTTGGADRLAAMLSADCATIGDAVEKITSWREAQRELAGMEQWRTAFLTTGRMAGGRIDTNAAVATLQNVERLKISTAASTTCALIVALMAVGGFWLSVVLSAVGVVGAMLPVWWAVLQFFGVMLICGGTIKKISRATTALLAQLRASARLVALLSNAAFEASANTTVQKQFAGAVESLGALERILASLDRRGNILGLLFLNVAMLSDFFLVRRFLRWQRSYINEVERWMDALSEIDARVSMATMRYNHPEAVDATLSDSGDIVFSARGLYHPFLGAAAVRNDFTIADGHYYIITGANMAGKSTFLRSVGVNYILAMCGMPVFADSLEVSVFSLFSSMRTTDDLSHGISYFNAELLRLSQLLQRCRSARKTLIILDEILKGTNSLDKLNGSRLFLTAVAKLPVSGVIATHDLELSRMADGDDARFHNYCFEIELGSDVTYSYKITPGVARNQNATYLLNKILNDKQ